MRKPAFAPRRGTQVSRTLSVPAPVGGWNARDALAAMKPEDAVILDNFFCTPYDVRVRYGYSSQLSGVTGTVNTLMSYAPPGAGNKLFAAAGVSVYDATVAGVAGSPVVTGLGNDKFQRTNFGTAGGNFLIAVNGVDLPLVYNGTAWGNLFPAAFNTAVTTLSSSGTTYTATMTAAHNLKSGMQVTVAGATATAPNNYNGTFTVTVTGANTFTYTAVASGSTPAGGTITATPTVNAAITGVSPSQLISVLPFKSRLFFIQHNTLSAWYLPTSSIGGAASQLDFSSYCAKGGYLMAMAVWTLDGGYGMDDYMAFITSQGEVLIYKGTDPASSTTWALVGTYQVGTPIGRRCVAKFGGDALVICKEGLAPLSRSLMSSRVNTREMLTDKVQHVVSDYTTQFGGNFGWQVLPYPEENMLLMNVPTSSTTSVQLAMNTISGAWSQFSGWNATCWEWHQGGIYFGLSGGVGKAWDTFADNGSAITAEALQSFNFLSTRTALKQVKMVRPTISTDGAPGVLLGVNADFDTSAPTGIPSYTPSTFYKWDAANWDAAAWGGDPATKRDWQTAFALGYCFAAHMKATVRTEVLRWSSTDYVAEPGGVI